MLNRLLIAPISSCHRAFKSVYSLIVLEKEIPSFKPKAIRIVVGLASSSIRPAKYFCLEVYTIV